MNEATKGRRDARCDSPRTVCNLKLANQVAAEYVLPCLITAFWTIAGLTRQSTFRTGIDLGLYTEAIQGYARGSWPWSALKVQRGFNLLGDHFTPIVSVLGPIYRVVPHVEVLIFSQALAIGITAAILARAASTTMSPGYAAGAICAAFGLSWGIAGMAMFDFHEVALGLPILAIALNYLLQMQWTLAFWWLLPLVLVKEDSAFLIAGFALTCWASRKPKLAVTALGSATALFAIIVGVLIPCFSFYGRYTYWAVSGSEIAAHQSLITNLLHNLSLSAISAQPFRTTIILLACSCFLAVWSPIALIVIPPLVVRFASASPIFWGVHQHYNALLMVVVFVALLDTWRRNATWFSSGRTALRMLVTLVLGVNVLLSWSISIRGLANPETYRCDRCDSAHELLDQIPNGAEVIADTFLVDHLIDRATVHLLVPGLVDSAGQPLTSQWVALDTRDCSTFSDEQSAVVYGIAVAKARGFVPVWSSDDGFVLMHYDPARAHPLSPVARRSRAVRPALKATGDCHSLLNSAGLGGLNGHRA